MPSQEELYEIAKLAGAVNSSMNDLAEKTDPEQRRWIPIRKVNPASIVGNPNSAPTVESVPVDVANMPDLRPKPLSELIIPTIPQANSNQASITPPQVKDDPNQLKLPLDFNSPPDSITMKMLLDRLDLINSKLTEVLRINRELYERKRRKPISK